jgi:integrase
MSEQNIAQTIAELKRAFPTFTDHEIANLAVTLYAKPQQQLTDRRVKDVVAEVREKYLAKEVMRTRAKLQPDGTIASRNTTTYRTYNTHWKRLESIAGEKFISELDEDFIENFADLAMKSAQEHGSAVAEKKKVLGLSAPVATGARSHDLAIDAVSAVLSHALRKKYITYNSAIGVKREGKQAGTRFALSRNQIEQIMKAAKSGGNDPLLDYLLLWTLSETAARKSGLIHAQLGDLFAEQKLLRLYEKGNRVRMQPITANLAEALKAFADSRGSVRPSDPLFRYQSRHGEAGRPLTAKRFETLWNRLRLELPWAEKIGVSSHWIRHTTITWVDRASNPTIAQAFAGHTPASITASYSKPGAQELANVLALLTGTEPPEL